jgi:hypothetical protein
VVDWTVIIVGALAALPPTLLGLATLIQGIKTHATFNSKMDKLLDLTRQDAYKDGVRDERASQKEVDGPGT